MSTAGPEVAVLLRALTADDVAALVPLERELFGAGAWSTGMLHEELTAPGRWYVAAVGTGAPESGAGTPGAGTPGAGDGPPLPGARVVGYAGMWFDGHDATVMTIGVVTEHQGRGVGRLLLDALVDHARGSGAESVLLEVRVDNAPALALYERSGFVRVGRRRGYYQPEDVDAWTMRLDLAAHAAPVAARPAGPTPGPVPAPVHAPATDLDRDAP